MRYKEISHLLSHFLFIFSGILVIPLLVTLYFDFAIPSSLHPFPSSFFAFFTTFAITLFFAVILKIIGQDATRRFYKRESLLIVIFIWIFVSILGAVPFYATKTIESPLDALFESVSGFSTTGSSIILPKKYDPISGQELSYVKKNEDRHFLYKGTIKPFTNPYTGKILEGFDAISKPILFWRAFIQWLGGIGIVFVFVALFPGLGLGGKLLYESEAHPDLVSESEHGLKPKSKVVASCLWKIYVALTLLEICLLYFTNSNVPLFDAICISFSTVSTGGFSIHPDSIGFYTFPLTQWIIIAFMIAGAVNFTLYYHLVCGRLKKLFSSEFLLFFSLLILCSALIFWKLLPTESLEKSLRNGTFQAVSALTCTGFSTENYDLWPFACQAIMMLAMFLGGMTGSTSGGIKTARHIILFRSFKKKLQQLYRPCLVQDIRVSSLGTSDPSKTSVFIFFWLIVSISAIGCTLFIFNGLDLNTAAGLTACSINNVGLTFKMAGPGNTCAFLPAFSKIVAMILMLLGRLEFFTLFIILTPSYWKSH